jgi:hypothetical protein
MEKEMTDTTETEINPFDDIDLETEIPDISPNPFDDIDRSPIPEAIDTQEHQHGKASEYCTVSNRGFHT